MILIWNLLVLNSELFQNEVKSQTFRKKKFQDKNVQIH